MSDEIDQANDRAIQAARHGLELTATGHCFNCGEVLDKGLRFCDKDCMTDWEARTCRG